MAGRARVQGLSSTQTRLKSLTGELQAAVAAAVREAAEDVQAGMRSRVAVDTGALQAGIKVKKVDDLNYQVGAFDKDLYYAEFIEHGTSSAPAQPFALPAAEVERKRLPERVNEHIRRIR